MNKKVKFLSTAACALLLSANVATTNVHASNIDSNVTISYVDATYDIAHSISLSQGEAYDVASFKSDSNTFSEFSTALQDSGIMTQTELELFARKIWSSSLSLANASHPDGLQFVISTDDQLFIFRIY